ncbi:MAG TPA: T9SS type A sorting domain-containing protein [Puia sp.]|nr:T9SS type A sorting domain-containing protein [Puia sp.]
MNKFYTLTIAVLSLTCFSHRATAQFRVITSGDWHSPSGFGIWDHTGEPPSKCTNCTITIPSGNTVRLNVSETLSGTTQLVIGTNTALGPAQLVVSSASGGAGFSTGYNIIIDNTGGTGHASIVMFDNSSSISVPTPAPSSLGVYDGVLIFASNGYTKVLGTLPEGFAADGTVTTFGFSPLFTTVSGPSSVTTIGSLPILLASFTAVAEGKTVGLAWTTSMESNSDHFSIERSTDGGQQWNPIGTVAAHGNSSVAIDYSFVDANPAAGNSEYRLQLVDRDGRYAYSEVRAVRSGMVSAVNIYPNPANDYVNVVLGREINNNVSVRLLNQSGQLLVERKVSNTGGSVVTLPVSGYPQGNYLILVVGEDGAQQVNKLFISK